MEAPSVGSLRDLEEMDLQAKLGFLREHKSWKNYRKTELDEEHKATWRANGLSCLNYQVLAMTTAPPGAPVSSLGGTVPRDAPYVRVTVDVGLNGAGHHDEWCGVEYLPEYLHGKSGK